AAVEADLAGARPPSRCTQRDRGCRALGPGAPARGGGRRWPPAPGPGGGGTRGAGALAPLWRGRLAHPRTRGGLAAAVARAAARLPPPGGAWRGARRTLHRGPEWRAVRAAGGDRAAAQGAQPAAG